MLTTGLLRILIRRSGTVARPPRDLHLARARAYRWLAPCFAALVGCADPDAVVSGELSAEFSNPIAPLLTAEEAALSPEGLDSADPFIFMWNGRYWLTHTGQTRVVLRSADTLGGLADAQVEEIWRPGEGGAPPEYANNVWAPEFHRLDGPNGWRWYLYVAADDGFVLDHRMLVLESQADDPRGPYDFKAILDTGGYAIDATVGTVAGANYVLYAGHLPSGPIYAEGIYLAALSDPWTIAGTPLLISEPTLPWEQVSLAINEGPQVLLHGPWLHVIFSADSCFGSEYKLGRLTVAADADFLDPATWAASKFPEPLFQTSDLFGVYGPGHGSFFRSPDGLEDWQVYHATSFDEPTCIGGVPRLVRAQRINWNPDGTPDLGAPVPLDEPLVPPSGDPTLSRQLEGSGPVDVVGGHHRLLEGEAYVGGRASEFVASAPGGSATYRIHVPADGTYSLRVRMVVGSERGIVQLDVDDELAPGGAIDTYGATTAIEEVEFGPMALRAGPVLVRLTLTGTSSPSGTLAFAADQIRLR